MPFKQMKKKFFILITPVLFSLCCNEGRAAGESSMGESIYKNVLFVDSDGAQNTVEKKFPGKNVLVIAYATWCRFCNDELPFLKGLQEKMGKHLEIVIINIDANSPMQVKNDDGKMTIYGSTTQNSLQEIMDKNGISGIPAAFLFTKDGELVLIEKGLKEWDSEKSIEELKEKLNIE